MEYTKALLKLGNRFQEAVLRTLPPGTESAHFLLLVKKRNFLTSFFSVVGASLTYGRS